MNRQATSLPKNQCLFLVPKMPLFCPLLVKMGRFDIRHKSPSGIQNTQCCPFFPYNIDMILSQKKFCHSAEFRD